MLSGPAQSNVDHIVRDAIYYYIDNSRIASDSNPGHPLTVDAAVRKQTCRHAATLVLFATLCGCTAQVTNDSPRSGNEESGVRCVQ